MTFLYMGLNSSTWGVIKSHKNKERERKEEKPKQKSKSGPISLSDRMGLLPGGGRLFQHIPCAHRFSGEIQLLLQQPWCRRTRMDDRSDYAVMHNNWIAAGRTSCVNMQSWFDWIQWKEHLNPGRQHFFFFDSSAWHPRPCLNASLSLKTFCCYLGNQSHHLGLQG